jgi:hypothetical protein
MENWNVSMGGLAFEIDYYDTPDKAHGIERSTKAVQYRTILFNSSKPNDEDMGISLTLQYLQYHEWSSHLFTQVKNRSRVVFHTFFASELTFSPFPLASSPFIARASCSARSALPPALSPVEASASLLSASLAS